MFIDLVLKKVYELQPVKVSTIRVSGWVKDATEGAGMFLSHSLTQLVLTS